MIELIKKFLVKFFGKYNDFFFVGSTDVLPPPLEEKEELPSLPRQIKICSILARELL